MENIATDKQYPKLSKASSGYLEIEHFKNADLHTGFNTLSSSEIISCKECGQHFDTIDALREHEKSE